MNIIKRILRKLKKEYRKWMRRREEKKRKKIEKKKAEQLAAQLATQKKAEKEHQQYLRRLYVNFYETLPVDKKTVLFESQYGKGMDESVLVLARLLCEKEEFKDYTLYASCVPEQLEERRVWFEKRGLTRIKLLTFREEEYYKVLATAGLLINEDNFSAIFIKRPEQTFLRLWNATPVNAFGKCQTTGFEKIGNTQRNIFSADYLLCPNEFTMERLAEDYMLANLAKTKILYVGRLENEVFYDNTHREEIRCVYGWENLQVFAYTPSVRYYSGEKLEQYGKQMFAQLQELNGKLADNQRVAVKLQSAVHKWCDITALDKIISMPTEYTPYQMLSATDGLITDYSAILLDYAVTGRKIVLFPFDKEWYLADKMRYQELSEFPFPQVQTVEELVRELQTDSSYDDTAFYEKYCRHNRSGMAKAVCERVLFDRKSPIVKEGTFPDNGKKNVLIYAGHLVKNGITTSIKNLLASVDREKYNYIIYYRQEAITKHAVELKRLPVGISWYGFTAISNLSVKDQEVYQKWKKKKVSYHVAQEIMYKRAKREYYRVLAGCRIDHVVQFDGYGEEVMLLMEEMPCKRTIYVHNDMELELKKKDFIRREVLSHAYQSYDYVAVVTPDLINSTKKVATYLKSEKEGFVQGCTDRTSRHYGDNICVVRNVIDFERILLLAEKEFQVDEETEMNVSGKQLENILASDVKKFITVGRFSAEKGHLRLIKVFEKLSGKYPEAVLVILGGYGPLYEKTVKAAEQSKCAEKIVIIKYLSNPYPLIKQCDYFVLPSYYEGFGLVLAEADILGLPCFSTRITGPTQFMEQCGGLLVDNTEKGILKGMEQCFQGEAPAKLNIDYSKYNKEAVAQFENMIQ